MLKVGDVVELRKGHCVYTDVPERYVYQDMAFSNDKCHHEVTIDEKYDPIVDFSYHDIANDIRYAFKKVGAKVDNKTITNFVKAQISKQQISYEKFCLKSGKFVVIKTKMDGGGRAHNDVYPDGHHVFVKRLKKDGSYDKNGDAADFYQSGCFSAMIEPSQIKVLGKMEMTFV